MTALTLTHTGALLTITLNRPEVRNAFNDEVITELTQAFQTAAASAETRAVVLAAEGPAFCAGADLNWMRRMADYTRAENLADAAKLAEMLRVFLESRRAAQEFRPKHCPACGDLLEAYQQPDVWVRGQRCSQGHTWAARGTHLGGVVEGALVTFNGEPSNAVLASLAAGWLNHNPNLDPQLHHSLRPVLESLFQQRSE